MASAVKEAFAGIRKNHGGPFGAVIVRNGKIIARAHNIVLSSKDPTAHAEIMAIRKASEKLGRFDLADCEIYSTCEPCPMCMGAIIWARLGKLYYGCSRNDAASAGFDDKLIYDALARKDAGKLIKKRVLGRKECLKPFEEWTAKPDKVIY